MEYTLEHFELKALDQGRLTGVSMAAHAIIDGFLLMHCGVGCKHKATSQLTAHDWAENVGNRRGWTEVGDAELIEGSADRIGPYLRTWHDRQRPGVIMVISVTFLDLTGDDYSDACRKAGEELSCPVLYVPAAGYDGDLFAGYASALVGLVGSLDWSLPITHPKRVAVLGYLFDRYEGDHQGNLMQLKGLLKGIGLELGPVLLSGKPYADLADTPMCGMLIQFPYVARRAKRLKRLSKRDLVAVDMPIGFRGTSNFLRVVGEDAGVDPKRIEAYITKKTAAVMSSVNILADRLRGLRVAIFADLPLCAGLISLLDEFGITTVLVGIRGTSLGGAPALHETLGRYGCDTAENLEIIEHPSIRQAAHSVWELYQAREIDGVLCSSTELCGISRVFTDHADEVDIRSGQSLFYVEIGFPSHRHHVIVPQPFMGFGGVVVMAQRIYDAHRILDAGPVGDR